MTRAKAPREPAAGRRAGRKPDPDRPERATGADKAYGQLRSRILSLDLAPGADLDELSLTAACGVSRTPLREALIRLAADRLVVLLPNRGYIVAPLLLTDFPQFIEAFTITQGAVSALAAVRRTDDEIRRMRDEAARFSALAADGDPDLLAEQNRIFHLAIGEAGHNEYFTAAYRRLLDESVRLARTCFAYDQHKRRSVADHDALIDAIARRDAVAAERIGREHAIAFRRQVFAYLEGNGADEVGGISLLDALAPDGGAAGVASPA